LFEHVTRREQSRARPVLRYYYLLLKTIFFGDETCPTILSLSSQIQVVDCVRRAVLLTARNQKEQAIAYTLKDLVLNEPHFVEPKT